MKNISKKQSLPDSFRCAWEGIAACVRKERNMKIHLCATAAVMIAGTVFHISLGEWLVCLIYCALVMGLELVNTAVEAVADLASPELHPLAKLAKDAAAGAVLLCAIFAAISGMVIFLPKFLLLLK